MRISRSVLGDRCQLRTLTAVVLVAWCVLMQSMAVAAAGGEACSAPSQMVGQGVSVSVAELMAAEANRVTPPVEPPAELRPTKPRTSEVLFALRRRFNNTAESVLVSAYPDDGADDRTPPPDLPQMTGAVVLGNPVSQIEGFDGRFEPRLMRRTEFARVARGT